MNARGIDPVLLPPADELIRCALHSEMIDLDPIGSALFVDEVVVVDLPLPWPKPVWAADGFTFVPEAVMDATEHGRRVRVLAAVPQSDDRHEVVVHSLGLPGRPSGHARYVAPPAEVARVTAAVIAGERLCVADFRVDAVAATEVLVCTQGSHDVCCGSRGSRFAADLEAARPNISVRRVSHTGGHRFAPTALTFPDFRMWGRLDLDDMLAIVDRAGRPSSVAQRCRGWLGADGPGQVAERAVMIVVDDWDLDTQDRRVVVEPTPAGWACQVDVGQRRWMVDVALSREVPVISCGEQGGLPIKPGREYCVVAEPREVVGL